MTDKKDEKIEAMKVDMGAEGARRVEVSYPSNANKRREEKDPEEKKIEKIVSGKVVRRKKPLSKRITGVFIGEDINSVGSYVVHDVLIPAAKSAISEMVQGGIEMLLFGERRGDRTKRSQGRSYVSYDKASYRNVRDDRRELSSRSRATHNFDDISLTTRGEAEEVLSHLVDLIIDYGQASVSDLYDLVGITGNFTDNKYGWTDLSSASVSRGRDGYLLNLPRTRLLD